jgi:hypothetical protein
MKRVENRNLPLMPCSSFTVRWNLPGERRSVCRRRRRVEHSGVQPALVERRLLVRSREQTADARRGQLMPLDGGQECLAREPRRQRRLDVERHDSDQIVMLAVAARGTGTEVVGIAACRCRR